MPSQMVHLEVVNALVKRGVVVNSIDSYVGSIAPDSIHMRANTTRRDKDITHLFKGGKLNCENALNLIAIGDNQIDNLRVGYGIHILTDYYWVKQMLPITRKRHEDNKILKTDRKSVYYNDIDLIDLKLYDKADWKEWIWSKFRDYRTVEFIDYVSADEVDQWIVRNLKWFEDYDRSKLETTRCVFFDEVVSFIEECTDFIENELKKSV